MATEILSPTYNSVKAAHTAATTTKTFLLVSSKPVLPLNTAAANADNVFVYKCSKVRAPKATGQAWAVLAKVYWDDTAKVFTTTSTSNTLGGYVAEAAASGDAEGIIHLDPMGTV